jgi:hypothetical protein
MFWYLKAVDQGDANAQVILGLMYDYGAGVVEDDVQAVFLMLLREFSIVQHARCLGHRIILIWTIFLGLIVSES